MAEDNVSRNVVPTAVPSSESASSGENLGEWFGRLKRNRLLGPRMGVRIKPAPAETSAFIPWVQDAVSEVTKARPTHPELQVKGAEVLTWMIVHYAQALEFYHYAEHRGDEVSAIHCLGMADGIREMSANSIGANMDLSQDMDFILDLYKHTDEFDVAKYDQRRAQIKQAK